MKTLLKNAREQKGLKTREVAQLLKIDQALISKFESGTRKPTKEQIVKLATLLEIDFETIMILWLKEKIIFEIGQEEFALKALRIAEKEIIHIRNSASNKTSVALQKLLDEIDVLKVKLDSFRPFVNKPTLQAIELEYTFESNRIEGSTLTLSETDLVVNEGQTIPGKSMREHLEAINHQEAIAFIKNRMDKNITLNEKDFLSIHSLILRGILPKEAGQYRNVSITLKEKSFIPSEPSDIQKEIEALFNWYEMNRKSLHPIILASTIKERLLAIHPFINGNGKVSRLLMNLILLQHGYQIANIKADGDKRTLYYQALKTTLTKQNKEDLVLFIAQTEKESLERFLEIN